MKVNSKEKHQFSEYFFKLYIKDQKLKRSKKRKFFFRVHFRTVQLKQTIDLIHFTFPRQIFSTTRHGKQSMSRVIKLHHVCDFWDVWFLFSCYRLDLMKTITTYWVPSNRPLQSEYHKAMRKRQASSSHFCISGYTTATLLLEDRPFLALNVLFHIFRSMLTNRKKLKNRIEFKESNGKIRFKLTLGILKKYL